MIKNLVNLLKQKLQLNLQMEMTFIYSNLSNKVIEAIASLFCLKLMVQLWWLFLQLKLTILTT